MQDNRKIKELVSIQLPCVSVHGRSGFQELFSSVSTKSWLQVYCLITLTVSIAASAVRFLFLAATALFSMPLFDAFCHLSSQIHSMCPEEESFSLIVHQLYPIPFQTHTDIKLIHIELFQTLTEGQLSFFGRDGCVKWYLLLGLHLHTI